MLAQAVERLSRSEWHKKAYAWGISLSYVLFALALTGVLSVDPRYLSILQTAIKYYVCAFLLIRFNPITHRPAISRQAAEFDRKIAFSAGVFLLLTTAATSVATAYVESAKATVERAVAYV